MNKKKAKYYASKILNAESVVGNDSELSTIVKEAKANISKNAFSSLKGSEYRKDMVRLVNSLINSFDIREHEITIKHKEPTIVRKFAFSEETNVTPTDIAISKAITEVITSVELLECIMVTPIDNEDGNYAVMVEVKLLNENQ